MGGCGKDSDQSGKTIVVEKPPISGAKEISDPMQANGDNVKTNAPVVDDPKQTVPGGSYRIAPANPNDPKYRADPRLGGGG